MELAEWLVQWTLNLASRVRCSPRTIYMVNYMTPGKATVTQKSELCMTKLCVLARAHVLHRSRVLVIALRSLSRKRRINMSLVPFLFLSRAGHFLSNVEFRDVLNPSDYFRKGIRYFLSVTCIRLGNHQLKSIRILREQQNQNN